MLAAWHLYEVDYGCLRRVLKVITNRDRPQAVGLRKNDSLCTHDMKNAGSTAAVT